MSGERPEERWLPTQSVATIMLSVISMLSDPNFSSPANVDASVRNPPPPKRHGVEGEFDGRMLPGPMAKGYDGVQKEGERDHHQGQH